MFGRLKRGLCFEGHAKAFCVLILLLFGVGCSSAKIPLSELIRNENVASKGAEKEWVATYMNSEGWQLVVVHKKVEKRGHITSAKPMRIYIEGDGHAYISRGQVSGDPTPLNPVALQLAFADKHSEAFYIGRPCQWVARGPECRDRSLWTTARFTEDVARRYTQLVRQLSKGEPVELIGYSGGAWVALQVAARLENVMGVTTVAGNLMPDVVNAHHKVTRIPVATYPHGRLDTMPVRAFVGRDDTIVPRGVVDAYIKEVGARHVQVVPVEATHGTGWGILEGRI